MKVAVIEDPVQWVPVSVQIHFETEDEAKEFHQLLQRSTFSTLCETMRSIIYD